MMSNTKCSGFAALTNKNPCALAHGQSQISPLKTPWFALRATKEKTAQSGGNFRNYSEMERFFELARTYFTDNER
jgi:hypothetical protein